MSKQDSPTFPFTGMEHIESQSQKVYAKPSDDALPDDMGDWSVKLWSTTLMKVKAGEQSDWQLNTSYALVVLLYGTGTLYRDLRASRLKQDGVYLCTPDSALQLAADEGTELAAAVLRWSLFAPQDRSWTELKEIAYSGNLLPLEVRVEPVGFAAEQCRMIDRHFREADPLLRWQAQLELQQLLLAMAQAARQHGKLAESGSLEHARAYIEERFHENLTMDQLASLAELSPKYFVESFKKEYGLSASSYITELRMNQAKRLMLRSDKRLRDIAHEVGYEDEFYFSRKFKKEHGYSPSQFMKRRRRKLAIYGCHCTVGYLLPLHIIPYAAPMHPKWTGYYNERIGVDIPYHLNVQHDTPHQPDNLAMLVEAKPDVILCKSALKRSVKEQLKAITDVIELSEEGQHGWRAAFLALAAQLDEEAEAERWLAAYDRKVKESRALLATKQEGMSVLFLRMLKDQLYVYSNQGIEDVVYGDLGIVPPIGTHPIENGMPITPKQLEEISCDRVLLLVCQESETLEHWNQLQGAVEWLSLRLVQENRIVQIPSSPWKEYSPEAMLRILEQAADLLSGDCPF